MSATTAAIDALDVRDADPSYRKNTSGMLIPKPQAVAANNFVSL